MIARVKVMSRERLIRPGPGIEFLLRKNPSILDRHCLISCVKTVPELPDHPNWLRLEFDDIRRGCDIPANLNPQQQALIFAEGHADRIIDFIVHQHACLGRQRLLIVNCALGVSRSGAVGTFANEMLGLSSAVFAVDNPQVSVNPLVLECLRQRWQARSESNK